MSVSHQLPPECPYKSYRELKRFWKNMVLLHSVSTCWPLSSQALFACTSDHFCRFQYGYRLPEDDTGMLFYQVYFRPLGYTLYTYPFRSTRATRGFRNFPGWCQGRTFPEILSTGEGVGQTQIVGGTYPPRPPPFFLFGGPHPNVTQPNSVREGGSKKHRCCTTPAPQGRTLPPPPPTNMMPPAIVST